MWFRKGIIIASQCSLRLLVRFSQPIVDTLSFSGGTSMQNEKWILERDDRVNGTITDNGGRRKREDRRQFEYTFHIPERRNGDDRRDGEDRRKVGRGTEVI